MDFEIDIHGLFPKSPKQAILDLSEPQFLLFRNNDNVKVHCVK